ncbi:DNA phosphorothioation-dependent restriction protein DptF [Azotobacter salinestris]|uniref:DNA phosphorothioation-dependent restriction protein DptF n=1 Tax=Azotobacter salinestris TaxID=69964 RepID=UPI0032DEB9AC
MEFDTLIGTLARSSAQAVSTLARSSDEIERFKDYLYIETDIEKMFISALESTHDSRAIIFLCGSSGDGKSELLKRHQAALGEGFNYHLDATHSFKPDQSAIQALDDLFDRHRESDKPLVVGINIGMLLNFQNTGSERHQDIKQAIASFVAGCREMNHFKFINFEDYPKFSLHDGKVDSRFVRELLLRITAATENNPLYQAFLEDQPHAQTLRYHNYRLLQSPAVQEALIRTLLHARLKFDLFFSARALLDFIQHLITGRAVLFDNVFSAPENALAASLSSLDPCVLRSKNIDEFLIHQSLGVADAEFEAFKGSYFEQFGKQELQPLSWIRAFHMLQGEDIGNNYHKSFGFDFSRPLLDEYIQIWQLHASVENKRDLRHFYENQLINGLRKFSNRLAAQHLKDSTAIYLGKRNSIILSSRARISMDAINLQQTAPSQINSFQATIKVGGTSIKPFPVTLPFLEMIQRVLGGYRPNRHDKSTIVILEEVVEEITRVANQSQKLYFHKSNSSWSLLVEDGDFLVGTE